MKFDQLEWTLCFIVIILVFDSGLARPTVPTVNTALEAMKLWRFLKPKEADDEPDFPVSISSLFPKSASGNRLPNFSRLRKLAGFDGNIDARYMSMKKPQGNRTKAEREVGISRRKLMASMPSELKKLQFTVPGSERELGGRASKKLRLWLWNMSSCPVLPLWKDLGEAHWPRYVNIGQCSQKKTCSYPGGMKCTPAKYKSIVTYSWYCNKRINYKGSHCTWVRMNGDVVEKCKCSC